MGIGRTISYSTMKWVMMFAFVTLWSGCKTSTRISSSYKDQRPSENNVISVDSERTQSNSTSDDEVIFEGTNNLFELVQRNASYFDKSHDVIIVKGYNNVMKLININVLDLSKSQRDTLIIVGSREKYVIDVNNVVAIDDGRVKTEVVHLKNKPFDVSRYAVDFQSNELVRLNYFDSLVTAKFAYKYFSDRLSTGDPVYFYELGEMYLYGIGVEESSQKAVALYEYAAVQDHVQSLRKLGDIFTGKFGINPSKEKSLYYYKRCGELGESYCDEQVRVLLRR